MTAATPVSAQVTVDLHALQALPEHAGASHPSRPAPSAPPRLATRRPNIASVAPAAPPTTESKGLSGAPTATPNPPLVAHQEAPPAAPAAPPALPENVPATASLAPITPPAPSPGAQPPPPPPVSDTATTAAAPTTSGLRLTFAPGQTDLSPASSTSIKQLTQASPGDETTFSVLAYAPGKSDDPSTARRTSLSRAMAVRSALVADGVPSTRIFVRALGDQYGNGPPDRVDLSVTGTNTPAPNTPANTATTR